MLRAVCNACEKEATNETAPDFVVVTPLVQGLSLEPAHACSDDCMVKVRAEMVGNIRDVIRRSLLSVPGDHLDKGGQARG